MPPEPRLTPEEESKDAFFRQLADVSQAMIAAHGKDFATGALVLAARWVADGQDDPALEAVLTAKAGASQHACCDHHVVEIVR